MIIIVLDNEIERNPEDELPILCLGHGTRRKFEKHETRNNLSRKNRFCGYLKRSSEFE